MSDVIEVEFALLRETIEDLVAERDGLQITVSTLRDEVGLLLTAWHGDAANAYLEAQNRMLGDGELRIEELNSTIKALHQILTNYETTESRIVALCG